MSSTKRYGYILFDTNKITPDNRGDFIGAGEETLKLSRPRRGSGSFALDDLLFLKRSRARNTPNHTKIKPGAEAGIYLGAIS